MAEKLSEFDKFIMRNPVIQFFKFIYLNIKIILIVTRGHGGTRSEDYARK